MKQEADKPQPVIKLEKSGRQEPPNPVEPQKLPTASVLKDLPMAVSPVLPSAKSSEKLIEPTKVENKSISPTLSVIDPPKNVIHEDAIAKEELQLKEDDSIVKKEQDRKAAELLKKLEEHKQEQQQLLQEQQNILDEIKSRDSEAKPIEPKKFNDNIAKIQEVIDNLKEKKQANDITMGQIIAEEKKKNENKKIAKNNSDVIEKIVKLEKPTPNISAVPLPLLMKKEQNVVAPNRDILELRTSPVPEIREKRDAEDVEGNCAKEDAKKSENLLENKENKGIGAPLEDGPPKDFKNDEDKKLEDLLHRREETRRRK